ncbi:hypothetical protein DY000_02040088 [Brassica cretica]|uniref:Uncharacterized protein n=1 Tax=Brassica cretica TaxID=69181 RepID=A0ABQ7BCJ3_BRACR|nr:hypothetical protein DY000_02040088 [Brassica cretica]
MRGTKVDSSQQNGADGGTTTTYTSVGSEESSLPHEILEDSNQTEAVFSHKMFKHCDLSLQEIWLLVAVHDSTNSQTATKNGVIRYPSFS